MIKTGDVVYVWPHGSDDQRALAKVLLLSSNGLSIAVSFEDRPPFVLGPTMAVHVSGGIVMMAGRTELEGKPWGPWVEIFGGGHYEIEIAGS
jgi:hypothetical protein